MEISISTRSSFLIVILLFFSGIVAGSHYYDHQQTGYSVTDSGFSIPEYESQSQLATELVAPFLFISILLKFSFERVLEFAFAGHSNRPQPWDDDGENVSREATLMSIAVTGMMIPTPFWGYVRLVASSISLIATGAIILVMLFLIYSFIRG